METALSVLTWRAARGWAHRPYPRAASRLSPFSDRAPGPSAACIAVGARRAGEALSYRYKAPGSAESASVTMRSHGDVDFTLGNPSQNLLARRVVVARREAPQTPRAVNPIYRECVCESATFCGHAEVADGLAKKRRREPETTGERRAVLRDHASSESRQRPVVLAIHVQ